jgi:t-SNARE complex subunit (syntaxin)
MLSGVLNSDIAIDANIKIMRVFVSFYSVPTLTISSERITKIENEIKRIKQDMEDSLADQNDINESTRAQLDAFSEALAELQPREPKPRRRIGFIQEEK